MGLNLATGMWEDDEHPDGGSLGEQAASPVVPMPPPPSQAPGAPMPPPPQPGTPVLPMQSVNPTMPGASVDPYTPQMPPPIPASRVVTPAEAQNLAAIDQNTGARAATAQDMGGVSGQGATARAQGAEREEFVADAMQQERKRIAAESEKRLQARTAQADSDFQSFKAFGIKDPEAEDSFGTKILKAIVVGMGQYAAGMNGGPNAALNIITEANRANIDRQKAEREKLFRAAERSKGDIGLARQERDDAFRTLDLKHSALLESSAAMLRAELARIGVPRAQIDANAEIQKIEQQALGLRQQTLASIRDDETALARADIMAAARRPAAGAGGGGANLDAQGKLAAYAQSHPGDTPGLYTEAAKLGLKAKDVAAALNQNKVPEGAQGVAVKAKAALTAIDTIEKLNYVPSRADVQKWMDNQRQVELAAESSKGGGAGALAGGLAAGKLQKWGALAQNEFDGMSPKAAEYFSNVRRYMENIGREASGAAISQGEWNNFYGQYGPQSKGGLAAARKNVEDRFRLTGVAGRTLDQSAPGGDTKKAADPRIEQARQIVNDDKAAERAAKQYNLTVQQVKAAAIKALREAKQADIVL